jgi:HK97 family phage major capsid protein/HK97 family phage prohead protease
MDLKRAYSVFRVKSADEERRTIAGIASTPEPDRLGDVVEPLGIAYKNPLPLLLHHDSKKPVGLVRFFPPSADGIEFEAELPTVDEPGALRDRIEEAWQSIKARLLSGVSIGFRSIEEAFIKETFSIRFIKSELLELSLVTIPANANATISTIKSLDQAASGRNTLRAGSPHSPTTRRSASPMTLQEQIGTYEATRKTKAQKMAALMAEAGANGTTLDETQAAEYDALDGEVRSLDADLRRCRTLETLSVERATAITATTSADASAQRGGEPTRQIQVRSNLPQGTAFTRLVMAKVYGKGDTTREIEFAKQWKDSTPEVELVLRAAVAPGTSTTAGWAAELAPLKPMTADFLEYLRPATILGRISGLHPVPFNITLPTQTAGGTYGWVGQGAPKPVSKLTFGSANLGITKCAGIIVITEELARLSTPSAEEVIRRDMRDGVAQFLDSEFTDPTKAPVAGVSPGSITNGVAPITSTGTTPANARSDIAALLTAIATANLPVAGAHILMSETNLMALSFSQTTTGTPAYPGLTPQGGTAMGVNFIGSQTMGANVVALVPSAILVADEGGINIDVSREASIQMDSAPDNPALATTILTSFWQNNLIGLRVERFINWKNVRTGAVQRTVQTYAPGTLTLMEAPTEPEPKRDRERL